MCKPSAKTLFYFRIRRLGVARLVFSVKDERCLGPSITVNCTHVFDDWADYLEIAYVQLKKG